MYSIALQDDSYTLFSVSKSPLISKSSRAQPCIPQQLERTKTMQTRLKNGVTVKSIDI